MKKYRSKRFILTMFVLVNVFVLFGLLYYKNIYLGKDNKAAENLSYSSFNNEIVVFDLDSFIESIPSTTEKYDYLKVAFTLQGLINRNQPVLFYRYQKGGANTGIDDFWLNELRKSGNAFSGYTVTTYSSFYDVVNLANNLGVINGVVLWDNNVPATSNVASTIAGVENLVPIRYDISAQSVYTDLVVNRNMLGSVKKNLVDKFSNINYLPDANLNVNGSGISSTHSPKNDAYLWAKKYYLDTNKTNSSLMGYSRDAWAPTCTDAACFVASNLPTSLSPGEEREVSITVLNNNTVSGEVWTREGNYRIAAKNGGVNGFTVTSSQFGFEQGSDPNQVRLYLNGSNPISAGERVTITFKIKAPTTAGTYYLNLGVVHDGYGWFAGEFKQQITVGSSSSNVYNNYYPKYYGIAPMGSNQELFNTGINSSDYLISKKAFFFDLSPDSSVLPIDDRSQSLGEDVRTLNKLLQQQSSNNSGNVFSVVGFVPWFVKYTKTSDPSVSNMGDVEAEWKMVEIISGYNGETDADAMAPVGLSNASFYTKVNLNSLTQNNDKESIKNGSVVKEVYDSQTTYFVMYMGDYDGGSWVNGVLPSKYKQDSVTDKYPLAWPIGADIANRLPQAYNWIYANQRRNDYFVAGDNGTGYLNPMLLNSSQLSVWKNHNISKNQTFDIDITGFLIGGGKVINNSVQSAYANMTNVLVGYQGTVSSNLVNNTPFINSVNIGSDANTTLGQSLYNSLVNTSAKFIIVRSVQ